MPQSNERQCLSMTKPTKWSTQSYQSSLCALWIAKDPMLLHVDSQDSDQTEWMPRLIRVLTRCTGHFVGFVMLWLKWTASSEFGAYRLCEQRRFRRACASAQSRQNLRCSLIQAVSQEEPSDRKPDPWPLWMAGHAQLKCVMTECSKTQIPLTGLKQVCSGSRILILKIYFCQ